MRNAACRCLVSLLTSLPPMNNLVKFVHEMHHDAVLLERVSAGGLENDRKARDVAHLASAQTSWKSRSCSTPPLSDALRVCRHTITTTDFFMRAIA